MSHFDRYAATYDSVVEESLRVTGEDKDYFARRRIEWLRRCLNRIGVRPAAIADVGCGNGSTAPLLAGILGAKRVVGIDESAALIERARRSFPGTQFAFATKNELPEGERFDLVYCSALFHHVAPENRQALVAEMRGLLRPAGILSAWEHNAWNPGARYVMSRCEFDRGAIPLSARELRDRILAGGFEVIRTDHLFIFPRVLGWLRWLEPAVSRFPLGAQFQVLARQ